MNVPLDIYQHISDICPDLMLHLTVKGIKGPSQFAIAKHMLQGKVLKGKRGRRAHMRYLYSCNDKQTLIDYVKTKKKPSNKFVFFMEYSHNYYSLMHAFRKACRVRSTTHYLLLH